MKTVEFNLYKCSVMVLLTKQRINLRQELVFNQLKVTFKECRLSLTLCHCLTFDPDGLKLF